MCHISRLQRGVREGRREGREGEGDKILELFLFCFED